MNKTIEMPVYSALVAFIISLICLLAHYITLKYNFLPNGDISEISITVNYLLYILLYYKVLRMGVIGEVIGLFRGKIYP
ncbi:amino acid permease, partial [Clostridium sp. HCS.1]